MSDDPLVNAIPKYENHPRIIRIKSSVETTLVIHRNNCHSSEHLSFIGTHGIHRNTCHSSECMPLPYFNIIDLTLRLNLSHSGRQFNVSNWFRDMSAIRQKRMHFFWVVCNYFFHFWFRLKYEAEQACSKWGCIKVLDKSLHSAGTKNSFFKQKAWKFRIHVF